MSFQQNLALSKRPVVLFCAAHGWKATYSVKSKWQKLQVLLPRLRVPDIQSFLRKNLTFSAVLFPTHIVVLSIFDYHTLHGHQPYLRACQCNRSSEGRNAIGMLSVQYSLHEKVSPVQSEARILWRKLIYSVVWRIYHFFTISYGYLNLVVAYSIEEIKSYPQGICVLL